MNVLVWVGSSRKDSFNGTLAAAALAALGADCEVSVAALDRLPFYDADLDEAGQLGAGVAQFRRQVEDADALVIASPAYNGSMSASVKNAIDVASRPRGAASIAGKPVAVLSATLNPRAAQWVVDHVTTSVRIAGAVPVGDGVPVGIGDAFTDGEPTADTLRAVAEQMVALRAAVAGASDEEPAA